jgi:hypothetical protein
MVLIGAVHRRLVGDVLKFVRSVVEDAGGKWNPDIEDVARCKISDTLDHEWFAHSIRYHAFDVARRWGGGSKDSDFQRMVRRVRKRLGPFIRDCGTTGAVDLLIDCADHNKLGLTPAVGANLRDRLRRVRGEDFGDETEVA